MVTIFIGKGQSSGYFSFAEKIKCELPIPPLLVFWYICVLVFLILFRFNQFLLTFKEKIFQK